ncbi:DegT/DnrJ/EryC1/StrS family aminotransferase [candidate division KSB1 bacterium]
MEKTFFSRRTFLKKTTTSLAGMAAVSAGASSVYANAVKKADKPAILGGTPVRTKPIDGKWPVYEDSDVKMYLDAFHKGRWSEMGNNKTDSVCEFEKKYAELMDTDYCVATMNGTTSLFASLNALGIGPGDEVIVGPYTFIASINAILLCYALPVFVDTDPETFMINADLIENRITEQTRAILPVHIGGGAADMDKILKISNKYKIPVVEDTCQAWLGEWRNKKLGSLGDMGCFSFQASKNLCCGEGGAIIGNDELLMNKCRAFRSYGMDPKRKEGYPGANLRITPFQVAILMGQMRSLEEQQTYRSKNAEYLDKLLENIPGVSPHKNYSGQTRHAYHRYFIRYNKEYFNNLSRSKFIKALGAEGISTRPMYGTMPLNKQPFMEYHLSSRAFKSVFSEKRLNKYRKENNCPENDKICEETGLIMKQTVLLAEKNDMEDIAEAIAKIQKNSAKLL